MKIGPALIMVNSRPISSMVRISTSPVGVPWITDELMIFESLKVDV